MKKLFLLFSLISTIAWGQVKVSGTVYDAVTEETLIGANVVYGNGMGVVTDFDGYYEIQLKPGTYTLKASFVGFEPVSKTVTVKDKPLTIDFKLGSLTLTEVEVTADVAIDRETPVAFSNVSPKQIQRELGSQDLPMVLNSTPGIYATQQGGGDGDARINIRGFSQRNVAVMIDGVPVNDMENGWVYWSNWFGLDAITQKMQVQRGLGASKLAIPSVGGTINILTEGIDQKRTTNIKQEVANDGFLRTTVGFNSGRLEGDWGFTVAGSYKRGNGWVDNLWTEGYFYYFKVDKRLGKHRLSLSGFGAPQSHAQRSFRINMADHNAEYARDIFTGDDQLYDLMVQHNQGNLNDEELQQQLTAAGYSQDEYDEHFESFVDTTGAADYGIRYNQHWGLLDRYDIVDGDTVFNGEERLTERKNYYHKPQFSLRDFWSVSDKLYISNVAYLSIGNGGGTRFSDDTPLRDENGQIDFQRYYDNNRFGPFSVDPNYSDTERKSTDYLESSINNHFWYGLLSTATYNQNKYITHSGGIDLRSYRGEHYREVYDLLGGDYAVSNADRNRRDPVVREGDKISYHNDAKVRWGGAFYQFEYKEGRWATFVNLSAAYTGYQRIDYFRKKDLVLEDTTLVEAIGANDTITYNGNTYTNNSDQARYTTTDWQWIPSFTIKTGAKYQLNENSDVFMNVGYLQNAPRFRNVFYFDNSLIDNIESEIVRAFEAGYTFRSQKFSLNANGYITEWKNRPVTTAILVQFGDETFRSNINGMDALHMGIEVDFAYEFSDKWKLQGLFSLGDWRWKSAEEVTFFDDDNNPIPDPNNPDEFLTYEFDATNVHVGDAAQTQVGLSVDYEPIQGAYIRARGTYFGRYFADFDPLSLFGENARRDSWKVPDYVLVDMHMGYRLKMEKGRALSFRASIFNVLDALYISDARNNDNFVNSTADFNANSASVWFGMGRRWNISLGYEF